MLAVLFPPHCGVCSKTGRSPCLRCVAALHPAPPLAPPPPLASLRALLRYDAAVARLVVGIKQRHERSAVPWLAVGLAGLVPPGVDVVTWAPTGRDRAARRGMDHAELLARAVAGVAGRPCHPTLRRRHGAAQHGRSRVDRLAGPSFEPVVDLSGHTVAVVDDVSTTGATLVAAAVAIVAAGADGAHGLAAAAVPRVRSAPGRAVSPD